MLNMLSRHCSPGKIAKNMSVVKEDGIIVNRDAFIASLCVMRIIKDLVFIVLYNLRERVRK